VQREFLPVTKNTNKDLPADDADNLKISDSVNPLYITDLVCQPASLESYVLDE
jgi:hypothetical protein